MVKSGGLITIGEQKSVGLSKKATSDLKVILQSELGSESIELLGNAGLEQAGLFLLTLMTETAKRKLKRYGSFHLLEDVVGEPTIHPLDASQIVGVQETSFRREI